MAVPGDEKNTDFWTRVRDHPLARVGLLPH
jgi:hypothetical protein